MSVSYPSNPPNIVWVSGTDFHFKHVSTDTTNNIARWEFYEQNSAQANSHGFTIRWNSTTSKNQLNVNDASSPYNNTNDPKSFSINGGSILNATDTYYDIQNGDIIRWYEDHPTNGWQQWGDAWTVRSADHLWSGSSGNNINPLGQGSSQSSVRKVSCNFW